MRDADSGRGGGRAMSDIIICNSDVMCHFVRVLYKYALVAKGLYLEQPACVSTPVSLSLASATSILACVFPVPACACVPA